MEEMAAVRYNIEYACVRRGVVFVCDVMLVCQSKNIPRSGRRRRAVGERGEEKGEKRKEKKDRHKNKKKSDPPSIFGHLFSVQHSSSLYV